MFKKRMMKSRSFAGQKNIWLRISTKIKTDMYSRAKTRVIKFTKAIDYVSYVCFPREGVVMALTSETNVKNRLSFFLFFHVQISSKTFIYPDYFLSIC